MTYIASRCVLLPSFILIFGPLFHLIEETAKSLAFTLVWLELVERRRNHITGDSQKLRAVPSTRR
jgi:hypothetical protein